LEPGRAGAQTLGLISTPFPCDYDPLNKGESGGLTRLHLKKVERQPGFAIFGERNQFRRLLVRTKFNRWRNRTAVFDLGQSLPAEIIRFNWLGPWVCTSDSRSHQLRNMGIDLRFLALDAQRGGPNLL